MYHHAAEEQKQLQTQISAVVVLLFISSSLSHSFERLLSHCFPKVKHTHTKQQQ